MQMNSFLWEEKFAYCVPFGYYLIKKTIAFWKDYINLYQFKSCETWFQLPMQISFRTCCYINHTVLLSLSIMCEVTVKRPRVKITRPRQYNLTKDIHSFFSTMMGELLMMMDIAVVESHSIVPLTFLPVIWGCVCLPTSFHNKDLGHLTPQLHPFHSAASQLK